MLTFDKFYKKSLSERLEVLNSLNHLTPEAHNTLSQMSTLSIEIADTIIENFFHIYGIPMGIASPFVIDGQQYHAPMVTEEPSVIAAAHFGAKTVCQSGGFSVLSNHRGMIGEIALYDVSDSTQAQKNILAHKTSILKQANDAYPSIVKRGGGAKNLWVKETISENGTVFLIVYLSVDTQEAMGANMLNTMLEAIAPTIESLAKAPALLSILSNFATESLVTVQCVIDPASLSRPSIDGKDIRDKIVLAYQLATSDIYRATTHNKGIMNGISAVVLATGNDTRAIEASAHAYASHSGTYQPLTKWSVNTTGHLVGEITVPLAVGFVGGSINIHPSAKLAQQLSQTSTAKELAALIASVGLAQNLSALRALVTEGIQKGHMSLQMKSLALAVGASSKEIPHVVRALSQEKHVNQDMAKKILEQLRYHS